MSTWVAPHTAQVQKNGAVGQVSKTVFCRPYPERKQAWSSEISQFRGRAMCLFIRVCCRAMPYMDLYKLSFEFQLRALHSVTRKIIV